MRQIKVDRVRQPVKVGTTVRTSTWRAIAVETVVLTADGQVVTNAVDVGTFP